MYIRLTVKSDVDFDTMCEKVVEEMGDVYSNRWVSEEATEYSGVDALHCLTLTNLYIKIQIFLSVGFVGFALKSPLFCTRNGFFCKNFYCIFFSSVQLMIYFIDCAADFMSEEYLSRFYCIDAAATCNFHILAHCSMEI